MYGIYVVNSVYLLNILVIYFFIIINIYIYIYIYILYIINTFSIKNLHRVI